MLKKFFSRFGSTDGKAHPSIQIKDHLNEVATEGSVNFIVPLRYEENVVNGKKVFDLVDYQVIALK